MDDVHWADDDALWVLEHLLDRVSDRRVSFVLASRPEFGTQSARWQSLYRRADVIALEGLGLDEVAALAEHRRCSVRPGMPARGTQDYVLTTRRCVGEQRAAARPWP